MDFDPKSAKLVEDFDPQSAKLVEDKSTYQQKIPEPIKNAIGGIESMGRMLWNVPAGLAAQGLGTLTGLGMGEGLEGAIQRGREAGERVSIKPFTEQGALADEMLGKGFEWLRDKSGQLAVEGITNESYDPNEPGTTGRANPIHEALSRSMGESVFDTLMTRMVGSGTVAGVRSIQQRLYPNSKVNQLAENIKADKEKRAQNQAYQEALYELDNNMVRYPQDYSVPHAPQLGIGRGKVQLPPDAELGSTYIGQTGGKPGQALMDAEQSALSRQAEAPVDYPPKEPIQRGLETTGGLGGPQVWDSVNFSKVQPEPLSKGPLGQVEQTVRRHEPMDVDINPVQRPLAIERLTRPDVKRAHEMEQQALTEIENLRKSMNSPENTILMDEVARLTNEKAQLQQRLQSPSIKGNQPAEAQLQSMIARVDSALARTGQGQLRVENLNKMLVAAEKRLAQATDTITKAMKEAEDIANKGTVIIRQSREGQQMVQLPKRMRGEIDIDFLMLGIPTLIKKIGESATLKKFVGTFRKEMLNASIEQHFSKFGNKLAWLSPEEFHKLAFGRDPRTFNFGERNIKRDSIKKGLETKAGLLDMPFLQITFRGFDETKGMMFDVIGHQGRHRMDVFKELGLEQIPVRISGVSPKHMDALQKALKEGTPVTFIQETMGRYNSKMGAIEKTAEFGSTKPPHEVPFRGFMNLDRAEFLPEQTNKLSLPKKQEGGASVELLTDIATLGIASLIRKGLGGGDKPKAPKNNPKPDQKAVLDAATGEARPLEEFKKTLTEEQKNADVPNTLVTGAIENLANASFLNHFTNNPYVKYVLDRVSNTMRVNNLASQQVKEGATFKLQGIVKSKADPNSPKGIWDALSYKEQGHLATILNEYGGRYQLSKAEIKNLGVSEKVADAYKIFTDATRKALQDVNSVRGDNPINELPGYMPRYRVGDFKVSVKDQSGATIYSDLFRNKYTAELAVRKLKERFPDFTIDPVKPVDKGTRGNPYNVSTVPFEELIQAIGRDDPRVAAIESVIQETKGRRGFGRHAIHRRNIEGGDLTPENFYKAFEQYVDSAYRYKANVEMKKMQGEFQYDTTLNTPRLKHFVNDYVDLASGSFKPGWLVDAANSVAEAAVRPLGFGPTASTKALQFMNNYFMFKALFGWRPPFLVAQGAQPLSFAPQWMAHYQAKGYNASIARAMFEGEWEILKSAGGKASPDFKNFIEQYQAPRGNIDPTMIHAMDLFGMGKGGSKEGLRWVTGHAPAQAIEAFGRLQASAMGYAFFKNAGLKGKELWQQAERFTNDVMVDYSKQEQPGWVGKSGILGTAAGPLSTFVTNYAATTITFLQDITANPGKLSSYKPMAIHIGQTALWAGLTGMLGVKIADGIIELFKRMGALDPQFPNVTELVMTNKDIPDWMAFGVISGATGMNFGASMAAPEFRAPGENTFPGAKLFTDFVTDVAIPVLKASAGKDVTQADKQNIFKTVLPNSLAALMDVYAVEFGSNFWDITDWNIRKRSPDEVVPNPAKRGFGNTSMNEKDQMARMFATRSLDEIREMEGTRQAKVRQQYADEQKTKLVDLATDIMLGAETNKDFGELMMEANKLGMPPKQFMSAVKRTLKNRAFTEEERTRGIMPKTRSQFDKYELIEDYKR